MHVRALHLQTELVLGVLTPQEQPLKNLRHVLLHEVEHLTTNHPFQLFWQHLVQVICWFHPAVWNAASRASLLREFTCDEVATNDGANSAAYLRTLLIIVERCERTKNASIMTFGRTRSEIK